MYLSTRLPHCSCPMGSYFSIPVKHSWICGRIKHMGSQKSPKAEQSNLMCIQLYFSHLSWAWYRTFPWVQWTHITWMRPPVVQHNSCNQYPTVQCRSHNRSTNIIMLKTFSALLPLCGKKHRWLGVFPHKGSVIQDLNALSLSWCCKKHSKKKQK